MSFQETLKNNFENYLNLNKFSNVDFRKNHFQQFINEGFPTLKNESWKYTPLNFLYKYNFNIFPQHNEGNVNFDVLKEKIFIPKNANIITFVNGFYSSNFSTFTDLDNVKVTQNKSFENTAPNDQVLNSSLLSDVFYNLNCAFANQETQININSDSNPLVLILHSKNDNESYFYNNRLTINFAPNSSSEVFIYPISDDSNPKFLNNYLYFNLHENSSTKVYFHQNEKDNFYQINNISINQAKSSNLKFYTFSMNGNFTRNFFRNSLNGEGIESVLFGIYVAKNHQIIDNHILMIHNSPFCHSNQMFKGILQDNSRGVFNGKILVQQKAQKTDAYQSNKNILTTKDASIYTKPELEIYADDVKCSHGATSGFLQNEELFYLRARGIDENIAKSLLLKGFAIEVIEKVENIEFKEWLYNEIDNSI